MELFFHSFKPYRTPQVTQTQRRRFNVPVISAGGLEDSLLLVLLLGDLPTNDEDFESKGRPAEGVKYETPIKKKTIHVVHETEILGNRVLLGGKQLVLKAWRYFTIPNRDGSCVL